MLLYHADIMTSLEVEHPPLSVDFPMEKSDMGIFACLAKECLEREKQKRCSVSFQAECADPGMPCC